MSRWVYLLLVLVRLYFALSPSYLHPDEHFQGPEVITGRIFSYPAHLTWEFTSDKPIRSIFPLWLVYGLPLTILKLTWEGLGYGNVPPAVAFYSLRLLMFVLSIVLHDWALRKLLPEPRQRRITTLLVASSYVTWTYQAHTFSNSIETLLVLCCLVLAERIKNDHGPSRPAAPIALAFLAVLGTFNRITFPAFVVVPLLRLLPHFRYKPLSLMAMIITATATTALAIIVDTAWYTSDAVQLSRLPQVAVITPWNNIVYNSDPANLAQHGLHPFWQHIAANLPQLLGPAFPLMFLTARWNLQLCSALCGVFLLSCFRHQEARFLLPAVPLLLSSIKLPARFTRLWLAGWITFNVILGVLMGIYHQGGVVPAQLWVGQEHSVTQVFWWKTYSPPTYLLGVRTTPMSTTDLMGMPGPSMIDELSNAVQCGPTSSTLLIAPLSANFLDAFLAGTGRVLEKGQPSLQQLWTYKNHLNLDDMDFGDDGIWPTLARVVGRRGIGVWRVHKEC